MAGMNEWGYIEFSLYEGMANDFQPLYNDTMAQNLFDAALFDHDISRGDRAAIMDSLRDYMWEEYGIDFDDVFDWEAYREAYDNAGI